jgi:heptosyltransferase-2
MAPARWENVLVLQTSYLGDTVLTLPLLTEIKRRFPRARLTFFCSPQGKELAESCVAIDDIIVDDKKGADRGWSGLWRHALRLRQRAFTLALTPHKSLRSALILYLAHIPCRVGFRQSKGWFLFTGRVDRPSGRHDVERNLSLLNAFGIATEDCARQFAGFETGEGQASANPELLRMKKSTARPLVGVNPGSVWATKRWNAKGYSQFIKLLKARQDCDVVIFGGPQDAQIAGAIKEACGSDCINLAAKLTLRELPAALGALDVFVTNDSGPMHIAVARGVSTVALFCATTPELGFYPYATNAVVLQKDLPCRPCSNHGGRRCPLGTEDCIRLIRPEHVLQAVERLLERRSEKKGAAGYEPEFVFV